MLSTKLFKLLLLALAAAFIFSPDEDALRRVRHDDAEIVRAGLVNEARGARGEVRPVEVQGSGRASATA